jgi:non-ribosomal peptide synthetase-like protein
MQRIVHLSTHKLLAGSPLMRIYLRLLGAKVGRDAIIGEFEEGAIDLLDIGPRASLGTKVKLANVEVIGDKVYVGRITIGADAAIGNAVVIGPNATVGEGAEICDLTCIPAGMHVRPWEKWDGSPAQKIGMVDREGQAERVVRTLGYVLAYLVVTMMGLLPIFPAFYVLYQADGWISGDVDYVVDYAMLPLLAWPAALTLVFVSMLAAVILRWTLLPKVKPGVYSIFSGFYFRKWSFMIMSETLLETLNSLYATMFMRYWYRAMGCKIGKGTEISSNFAGRYDLIELGDNNFLGDETIFGDEDVRNGYMTLKTMKTGDRVFFGNFSVIAGGSVLENDSLVGVKSRMPDSLHAKEGEIWFGSPAIKLPTRQKVVFGAAETYQPPWYMRACRMIFEALHTSFPTAALITSAYLTADVLLGLIAGQQWIFVLGTIMVAGVVISVLMYLLSVGFKWLLMGVYKPVMKPMWSWWAMRTEAVAVFYGGLSSKMLLDYLRGTPFLPWALRLYGAKIGKGVWMNITDVTEFDCVTIGDFSVLNSGACPQTHLYEDRVMKVGRLSIGKGVTIGTAAVVLYDTHIQDYAQVGPLTLVMEGETLPAHSSWIGSPAQTADVQRLPASTGKGVLDEKTNAMAIVPGE